MEKLKRITTLRTLPDELLNWDSHFLIEERIPPSTLRTLWVAVLEDLGDCLGRCPEDLHAHCPRAAAQQWLSGSMAELVFNFLRADHILERVLRLEKCQHYYCVYRKKRGGRPRKKPSVGSEPSPESSGGGAPL